MLRIRASANNFPRSLYDSGLKKKRVVGILLILIMLAPFLAFNRIPKLDTVQADLAVVASPVAECFQGFCIESPPEKSFFSRWWDFSLTYLRLVAIGMTFAFLVAGATEAFIFPNAGTWTLTGTGIKGSLKGLMVGPAMNLCSACIVPVASAFRRRGSGIETTLAITQGSSTFNLPALIMVSLVFAPLIGGARIGISLIGALLIGPLVAKVARERMNSVDSDIADTAISVPDMIGWKEALGEGFKDWARITAGHVIRLAPVMILAGFVSGFAIQWLSPETVSEWLGDDLLGVLLAATIGIAINVPLLFEIPLVAALLLAGMGTAPAAALLFTAAAAGPITFWGLSKVMPKKAIFAFGVSTWALGALGGALILALTSLGDGSGLGLRAAYDSSARGFDSGGDWASSMRFTDVTSEAGITHTHTAPEPLLEKTEPRYMTGGAVAEDFDGDGWVDIFMLRGGESPAVLYMNNGNGSFTDEAALRGADIPTKFGAAAAAADYDNDGDVDIVAVSQRAPHYLLINDGDGTFTLDDTTLMEPKMFATSPSWGDVNNDGMLELALGEWNPETAKNYDAATKATNDLSQAANDNPLTGGDSSYPLFLYANDGQGRLATYDFREGRGIDLWVFAPRFADLDDDGLTDLAVVADYGMSRVYRNVGGGKFRIEESASPAFTDENGMGSAIGDYDNDGDLDWFVSSIFGQTNPDKGVFGGTGNRMYRNESEMRFADLSAEAGIRDGGWGWAASFGDLDNDGDLDLYHVNGWVQDRAEGDPEEFDGQSARLFENGGYRGFHEVGEQSGASDRGQGRGVILFDYDNDGDLDIFITNNHEYVADSGEPTRLPVAPTLLRNDTPTENHWLVVTLEGAPPLHSHGIGSRIYVTADGRTQMRELHASTNFAAQEPGRIAHFGLGKADIVEEIRVEWVNGETTALTGAPVNRRISISNR